jgi:CheY-like chemotaxis protein
MFRILVIDDELLVLEIISKVLSRAGYQVTAVTDGQLGLDAYAQDTYDLVITDLVMPEKEGIETIRELLKLSPELRIIAISGGGAVQSELYLHLAEKFGAKKILRKPFTHNELLAAVSDVLADTPV